MSHLEFTTVVAADQKYLPLLQQSWQTWQRHRHQLFRQPLVVLYDPAVSRAALDELPHKDKRLVKIPEVPGGQGMREKVLTAFVKVAPFIVATPWWLKVDADTVAERDCGNDWCDAGQILGPASPHPCMVASGWNYTKPADAVAKLDAWAGPNWVGTTFACPPLNLPYDPASGRVITRGRIASYVCWHSTVWSQQAAQLCPGRLPVPSHDTYFWYVARRQMRAYRCLKMKNFGWSFTNHRRLAETVRAILEKR